MAGSWGMNMKFTRYARIKDRIIELGGKAAIFALTALICLWMISGAKAASWQITDIREEPRQDGSHIVEFRFSAPIEKDRIAVEFQRNFIQLSLKGVTAYPARTKNLEHSKLDKVFTYQYQPDLARARVLLKGLAAEIQSSTAWEIDGNALRVILNASQGAVVSAAGAANKSAAILPAKAKVSDSIKTKAAAPNSKLDAEDDKLIQEILSKTNEPAKIEKTAVAASTANVATQDAAKTQNAFASTEDQPVFSSEKTTGSQAVVAKEKTSPAAKVFGSLLMVIGIIGAGALAFRRFALGKGIGLQKQGRVIEVLANQTLGPKRSIALVKVLDQYMVVGMGGENMTLLANLGNNVDIDKYIDEINPSQSFSTTLRGTLESSDAPPAQKSKADVSIRASIKKRIEGFKPL